MAVNERLDPLGSLNYTQTIIGTAREGSGNGIAVVNSDTVNGKASALVLLDSAGTERLLWFTTNGTLMTGTRTSSSIGGLATPNGAADASHVIVGAQTTV